MTSRGGFWLIGIEAMYLSWLNWMGRPDDEATRRAWAELNLLWSYE